MEGFPDLAGRRDGRGGEKSVGKTATLFQIMSNFKMRCFICICVIACDRVQLNLTSQYHILFLLYIIHNI